MNTVYFDNAATTWMLPEVVETVNTVNTQIFGNPSGAYSDGLKARKILNDTRRIIADSVGAETNEIYFTAGGCEGDNWILKGIMSANSDKGKHLIVSKIEHHAILNSAEYLSQNGYRVTYVSVNSEGVVDPCEVEASICDDTVLISVMAVNNETGMIQPISDIGRIAKKHGVLFHTDAVQAYTKIDINVSDCNIDLLTVSAHKFHGPKGIGFVYIKNGVKIDSLIHGGTQERSLRAGTENVSAIAGLGKAIEIASAKQKEWADSEKILSSFIYERVMSEIEGVSINGCLDGRVPGILNLSIEGIEGETLLIMLDMKKIAVSTGSACAVKLSEPSHVLVSMGKSIKEARGSIRISLSGLNTMEEAQYFVNALTDSVNYLRKIKMV